MPRLQSQYIKIIYFDNQSTSDLALIFIHGNFHGLRIFRHQVADPALNSSRLIAFDLPGHGLYSLAPSDDMSLFINVLDDLENT
jgi:pimeloyl-ACP methyl ester carboxylesterase